MRNTYEQRESFGDLIYRSRRNSEVFMAIWIFEETVLELAVVVRLTDPLSEDES